MNSSYHYMNKDDAIEHAVDASVEPWSDEEEEQPVEVRKSRSRSPPEASRKHKSKARQVPRSPTRSARTSRSSAARPSLPANAAPSTVIVPSEPTVDAITDAISKAIVNAGKIAASSGSKSAMPQPPFAQQQTFAPSPQLPPPTNIGLLHDNTVYGIAPSDVASSWTRAVNCMVRTEQAAAQAARMAAQAARAFEEASLIMRTQIETLSACGVAQATQNQGS